MQNFKCPYCHNIMKPWIHTNGLMCYCNDKHIYNTIIDYHQDVIYRYDLPFIYNKEIYWIYSSQSGKYTCIYANSFPTTYYFKSNSFMPFCQDYQKICSKIMSLMVFC